MGTCSFLDASTQSQSSCRGVGGVAGLDYLKRLRLVEKPGLQGPGGEDRPYTEPLPATAGLPDLPWVLSGRQGAAHRPSCPQWWSFDVLSVGRTVQVSLGSVEQQPHPGSVAGQPHPAGAMTAQTVKGRQWPEPRPVTGGLSKASHPAPWS